MWQVELAENLPPSEAALRLAREGGLAWLDGGLTHGHEGRFSFVGVCPVEVRRKYHGDERPLQLLDELACRDPSIATGEGPLQREEVPHWVGHVAYDAHARQQARLDPLRARRVPTVCFARYDALYAYDHAAERGYLVGDDPPACARLEARLSRAPLAVDALQFRIADLSVTAPQQHHQAIVRALAHIRAGDVYEINLARRYVGGFEGSALGLFMQMRDESPVPLGYFCEDGPVAVLGRSMERFLRWRTRDRLLWTSPIKGTIARLGQDAAEAEALRADAKEHAEHAMVVDLMRNDLGRVAEIGSVEIEQLMAVLPFAGLSHLVSTVRARARADLTLGQLLECTFPPGSVTGTPKTRALEIIEALEDSPRGIYTGAVGFVDRARGLSLAVAIRTAVVCDRQVEYFAGGGIVWGSEPAREIAETELKAQVFLRAANVAR